MDAIRRLARGTSLLALLGGVSEPAVTLPSASALPYERVGSETGLRSEVVTALYQDRTGFIWLGSREGLTVYDGYVATGFEHDTSDPASLSDNPIRTVYQDRRGDLWVGTNTHRRPSPSSRSDVT